APRRRTAAAAARCSAHAPGAPRRGCARATTPAAPARQCRTRALRRCRSAPRARAGSARSARGAPRTRAPRRRRARRARTRRSGRGRRGTPCFLSVVEKLAQAREPGEHPALDRAERLPEPLRELGLREPAVVRELECLALLVGELAQRGLHALTL